MFEFTKIVQICDIICHSSNIHALQLPQIISDIIPNSNGTNKLFSPTNDQDEKQLLIKYLFNMLPKMSRVRLKLLYNKVTAWDQQQQTQSKQQKNTQKTIMSSSCKDNNDDTTHNNNSIDNNNHNVDTKSQADIEVIESGFDLRELPLSEFRRICSFLHIRMNVQLSKTCRNLYILIQNERHFTDRLIIPQARELTLNHEILSNIVDNEQNMECYCGCTRLSIDLEEEILSKCFGIDCRIRSVYDQIRYDCPLSQLVSNIKYGGHKNWKYRWFKNVLINLTRLFVSVKWLCLWTDIPMSWIFDKRGPNDHKNIQIIGSTSSDHNLNGNSMSQLSDQLSS